MMDNGDWHKVWYDRQEEGQIMWNNKQWWMIGNAGMTVGNDQTWGMIRSVYYIEWMITENGKW